jgi:hypothetical protein
MVVPQFDMLNFPRDRNVIYDLEESLEKFKFDGLSLAVLILTFFLIFIVFLAKCVGEKKRNKN